MAAFALIPRSSEKAYATAQNDTYVFVVPKTANKQQIASVVEEQYGVKVAAVNVVLAKGKPEAARRGRRARPGVAHRTTFKKAYVRVSEGTINLFDETEETK